MSRVIDGKDLILGRLCSHVAKQALLGETIDVVNVEQIVITGKKETVFGRYKHLTEIGRHNKGPFVKRSPVDLFKRSIRNMVPRRKARGQEALARIKAYRGLPERFKDAKLETLEDANVSKVPTTKYVRIKDVTKFLGGK